MNTNHLTAAPAASRKTAILAGMFLLLTDVTSIAALPLYGSILGDPGYITGAGPDTLALLGVMLEVILALAIIGNGVVLYPVFKRYSAGAALGFTAFRTLEAAVIAVGVVPLLAVVTLRQQMEGVVDPATLEAIGAALVSFHNWTFLLGPGLIYPMVALLAGYLLYSSRLAPRFIPSLCFTGGVLVFASNTAKLFGLIAMDSPWLFVMAMPALAWEVSLSLWLIFKGFNRGAAVEPAIRSENLSAA
ncbi:MAG: DUF4386 domain-containing protein, partial [Chloroflexota bacterium]